MNFLPQRGNYEGKTKTQSVYSLKCGKEIPCFFNNEKLFNNEIMSGKENGALHCKQTSFETISSSSNDSKTEEQQNDNSHEKLVLVLKNDKEALSVLANKEYLNLALKNLIISSCDLLKVPNIIFKFKYLTDLNLSNNSLENLPEEIKNLQNLLSLNLSSNNLTYLPNTLKHVHQLTYLNLSYNRFLEIPHVLFYGLRNIRTLDLSFNEISRFKDPPECLTKIVELRLSNNILESLPEWIFNNLCQLQVLDIRENPINLDAQSMLSYYYSGVFETLRELNIENCNYNCDRLEFLSHFKNLQSLYIGNKKELIRKNQLGKNYLGNLKMDIFKNIKQIKSLFMDNAQISILPHDFECVSSVEILNLSSNLLSWLSDNFCHLISLKVVDLSSNQLLFLPNDIDKLVNLEQLHLENNKLYQLPESFSKLRNLKFVDLYNNIIEKLDVNILNGEKLEGVDLGLNYLDFGSLERNENLNKIEERYDCLKNVFRKRFNYANDRVDIQNTKIKRNFDELSQDSSACSAKLSTSFGDDDPSDNENAFPVEVCSGGENWEEVESCEAEEDELFDPNDVEGFKWGPTKVPWSSPFRNNFCPANGHVQSVMRTYARNFKLTSKNDSVEEGQFDSD